jgi:hypothetical protein
MSNFSVSITVDSALNLLSLFSDSIALMICLTFLSIILYRLIRIEYNRGQMTIEIPLILSNNTLCIIIIKSTMQIIHVTVPTLLKDFQIVTEFKETFFYQVRAYSLWSMIGVLYWSYVLLAFFRFVRVIYPTHVWLHRSCLYFYVLIPAQFIIVFIGMLPILIVFDGIHLLTNEAYCSILLEPFYFLTYSSTIFFVIPYNIICIFYMWIGRQMRQPSLIRQYQERNRRDYIVMRRMLLNVIILCIVIVPYYILYIFDIIYDRFDSLIYRVQWLSSSLSSCLFSLILPVITTQLRDLLKRNRLTPANNRT